LEIDHVRKNHHRIPTEKLSGQFLVEGYFDYPPVFPTLMSFIPKKTLLHIQGFIAPFFDSLQVVLVYYVAIYITNNHNIALISQLVYMLTPMIAIENSYLTPRSLGYLNFSLATIFLLMYMYNGEVWVLGVVGVVWTMLLFLTHRFALQSFFFITIFFTLYLKTLIFAGAFGLGLLGSLVITRGYYLRVLKGHISNIHFWVKNLDYRYAHQVRGLVKKETKADLVNVIYTLMSVFSPVALFGMNPWAVGGLGYVGLAYYKIITPLPILSLFAAWVIFFYILGVIVMKVRYLMPIGEGYRYMEMATVPSAILSTYILFELIKTHYIGIVQILFVLLLVCNFILIIFFQFKTIIKDKNRSVTDDWVIMFDYINKMKTLPRIICIPHQNTTMTIYHTKAQVLVNADNPGLMRLADFFPVIQKPLKEIAKKYNLTHVLINESFATLAELKLSEKDVVFHAGGVKLVRL